MQLSADPGCQGDDPRGAAEGLRDLDQPGLSGGIL